MSQSNNSESFPNAERPLFDEDAVFSALAGRARLRLLASLAKDGPQTAIQLETTGRGTRVRKDRGRHVDSTLKNLKLMVHAGIVVEQENSLDGRRTLYALSPAVKVTATGDATDFDFGFVTVTLGPDGD